MPGKTRAGPPASPSMNCIPSLPRSSIGDTSRSIKSMSQVYDVCSEPMPRLLCSSDHPHLTSPRREDSTMRSRFTFLQFA